MYGLFVNKILSITDALLTIESLNVLLGSAICCKFTGYGEL